jgi:excinuclease ABC subunit A
MSTLRITGAREHNLRGFDLQLPHGQHVGVVGPSGSGKTTLVFDTIVRESQRRFLGSLSPRARMYLGKLGRSEADGIDGLPMAIAVGQRAVGAHARSTVGTRSGVLDLLRLLFAREGVSPDGAALTRAHFSFNHADGACPACRGLGLEDRVDPALLVADPSKSLRDGALRPTLKNGYTVYSQVTVDVMDRICRAHGFDVDTPWEALAAEQRHVVLYGTTALKVPFGKHGLASRMKWAGITARPREEGHYRGIVPVIEETLQRNRNANVLRYVRSVPCSVCAGTRLGPLGRETTVAGHTLPGLLALPTDGLVGTLGGLPGSSVWGAIAPGVAARLGRMVRLGLGHLSLDRPSTTLSGGEAQRLRLAAQLASGLGGMLIALDEPTLGLHPEGQAGMLSVMDELRALGNTLLVVEHDPDMVRHADHLVALGPGAGPEGGAVLFAGPLADGPGGADPLGAAPRARGAVRPGDGALRLRGARLHNLRGADLEVRLGAFNVVTGPSGAGKSSLVFGTLLPALEGAPGGPFDALEGAHDGLVVRAVDAQPIGRTPRSTPATWSGVFDLVRKRFAALPAAKHAGLTASRFSFNTRAGRCPDCEGLGVLRIGLHLLADVEVTCATCGGARYAPEVLGVRLRGQNIADVLGMPAAEALAFFAADAPIAGLLQPMVDLGLGYLRLGQSSTTLSRGEAQRVKLATLIGRSGARPTLLLMDEPDRGLHPGDVRRLLAAIDALVGGGHTVLAISHHRHLWAAADHLVQVRDGRVTGGGPLSAAPLSRLRPPRPPAPPPHAIELLGVRTNNLRGIDVRIPHRALTVVAGVSGSGKSSLVFDTLAAEAWGRFSESLPFAVRRHVRRQPRPPLDAARGLTPTLALSQRAPRAGVRSTVATQSGVGPLLRLLFARAGTVDGAPCGMRADQLSPDQVLGACPQCEGRGWVSRCSPARLVSDPGRSLRDGALGGTRPGRFLGEPDGQYLATLGAIVGEAALDVPWERLPPETQATALGGAGDRVVSVTWRYQRGARAGEHAFEGTWVGLCGLVEREARVRARRREGPEWAALLEESPCPGCAGARLNARARSVLFAGQTLPDLMALPLPKLRGALDGASLSRGQRAVADAICPDIRARLDELCALGLSHLQLDRSTPTLSDGELQRVRLAAVSRSGLTGLTVVLDEPSAGLHASDIAALLARLRGLRDSGNTVVVVDHRPDVLRAADHILELGPGAGPEGGDVVAEGPPERVLEGDGLTARALRAAPPAAQGPLAPRTLRIRGAGLHNLRGLDLDLPSAGFVAVTGPSGSGKSSLVFGVLAASAQAGHPVGCQRLSGLESFGAVRAGASGGQTPLDALALLPALQSLFHGVPGHGLARRAFSFRSPAGRCPACKGTGAETVSMDALADLRVPCPRCHGARFRPEVLGVRWRGLAIDTLLAEPVAGLLPLLPPGRLRDGAGALVAVGLGHLALGRATRSLSGGELQRLGLAQHLRDDGRPTLHLLDEPARGLHEADITSLVGVFAELRGRGDLVVASVHRRSLVAAADLVVELGPGAGPEGGRLVSMGPARRN